LPYPSACVAGKEIIRRRFLGGADLFGSPTSIMYRSDQVLSRENFYNADNLHADTEVCFEILQAHDFGFVHQVLTFTRRHNETTSTYAKRMQTYMPSDLMMLKKFGPSVLSEQEMHQAVSRKMKHYYRFLGFRLLKFRERQYHGFWSEFWAYHKKAIHSINETFSWTRVYFEGLISLYNSVLTKLSHKHH
jgi:hypothetical protein